MATMHVPEDFKEFLSLLNSNHVEYLLIGGYAVGCHGRPRATEDLDIWIRPSHVNAERMMTVLREFGFLPGEDTLAGLHSGDYLLRMGVPPLRVEVLTSISGVDFDRCYPSRVSHSLDGLEVALIGRADLIKNKLASGRPKDLADIQTLERPA